MYFLVNIGGGEFKRRFIKKMVKIFFHCAKLIQKEFHNLKCIDLTKMSPTIVENFIQRQDLNNLQGLCFKKCMIQKLPSNLFSYSHLQILDSTQCQYLQNNFDFLNHNVNSSLNGDQKKIFIYIFN